MEHAELRLGICRRVSAAATHTLEQASAQEQAVQLQVAEKLESLLGDGLTFSDETDENEFKSLLFRKILDGRLGSVWDPTDEQRFQQLFLLQPGANMRFLKIDI
jgi:hypothetical protein